MRYSKRGARNTVAFLHLSEAMRQPDEKNLRRKKLVACLSLDRAMPQFVPVPFRCRRRLRIREITETRVH